MTRHKQRSAAPWVVLESRDVYVADPWLRLSLQRIQLPDGVVVDDYYRIALPDYTVIVATTPDGRFIMERGYKHGPQREVLCLPAGIVEDGEDAPAAARRELLEETGYAADQWQHIASFNSHGNYGCGRGHIFRAFGARHVAPADSGDLEDYRVELLTLEDLSSAIERGEIAILSTVAALSLVTHPLLGAAGNAKSDRKA